MFTLKITTVWESVYTLKSFVTIKFYYDTQSLLPKIALKILILLNFSHAL